MTELTAGRIASQSICPAACYTDAIPIIHIYNFFILCKFQHLSLPIPFIMKLSWYLLPVYAALVLAQGPVATQPKIFFLGTMGGISHTAWVLEILDLVRTRGYNVSYVSYQPNEKYIKNYPDVGFIPLPIPRTSVQFRDFFDPEQAYSKKAVAALTLYFKDTFADHLNNCLTIMKTEKPDVMMCDHIDLACMDAAKHINVPVVVTSTVKIRAGKCVEPGGGS